ncbi:hypothetical protein E2C01_050855 [Portunus trituberculatus]|uniref:Uncharacterized protein n=1 Tax=Portunus trituberculatus TaxID=210409 RepID=A0A5B7GH80_PORTR|nr:hypothetical protein [Portunus trituberculatus]
MINNPELMFPRATHALSSPSPRPIHARVKKTRMVLITTITITTTTITTPYQHTIPTFLMTTASTTITVAITTPYQNIY